MTTNKTIKFFISSTFKDFIKERNALQNFVFPRLKKLCQKEKFYFQPVDLRWGVTEESSEDNKTMEYCLNEVKRCSTDPKPNLLILFGQRYGWGPLPSYLTVDEYNVIIDYYSNPVSRRGLYLKYYHPSVRMLNKWYNQDKNDKEKKYFLKDKKGLDRKEWEFIEKELKEIIQIATQENKEYSRFHTSATEQEIRDAIEEQYRADSKNTIVYYRTFSKGNDKDLIEGSKEVQQKLFNLKKFLESSKIASIDNLEINVKTYNEFKDEYHPIDKESYEYPKDMPNYLKEFCESIYKEFESKILDEIAIFNKKLPSPLKIDLEEQTRFLKEKSQMVIGRDNEVDDIVNFVQESKEKYYLLYGKSGSGKTSVMAKAISDLQKENILYRFIGTTAHTTSPRNTYEFIYWQITDPEATKKPHYMESDDQKFYLQFQKALENYSKGEKLTLFIDAVDQFNGYDSLEIFLTYVPQNVKVVFSVLYDEEKIDNEDYVTYYKQLEHIPSHKKLEPLSQSSNIEILKNWLENDGRTLLINKENNQQALVEQFIENKTPLYLRLVYEIVREWKSTDHIVKLENKLANTEEGLIVKFFDNVINKHYVKKELLELTLGLISASKYGLSESELIDVLSNEKDILSLYEREGSSYPILEKLPDSIFSKMYYHIQDIFTEKLIDDEMLINPYHRIIEEVIRKEYYEKNSNEFHSKLADYFLTLQDKEQTWDKRYNNPHMLDEVPYQLFHSNMSERLKEVLFDLEFAGSVYDQYKQVGFRDIMEKVSKLDGISESEIYPWESFYREKEHLITKVNEAMWRPHKSLFQLAYEDGLDSPLTKKSIELLDDNKVNFFWFKSQELTKNYERTGLIKYYTNIIGKPLGIQKINKNNCFILVQYKNVIQRWNLKGIKVDELSENQIVNENIEKIFDYYEKQSFLGDSYHSKNNLSIDLQDGRKFTSEYDGGYYQENRFKLLTKNNKIIKEWEAKHNGKVFSLGQLLNGNLISIGYLDKTKDWGYDRPQDYITCKLWTKNGDALGTLKHDSTVKGFSVLDNERFITLDDKKIRIWNNFGKLLNENESLGADKFFVLNNSKLIILSNGRIYDYNGEIKKSINTSIITLAEVNDSKIIFFNKDKLLSYWEIDDKYIAQNDIYPFITGKNDIWRHHNTIFMAYSVPQILSTNFKNIIIKNQSSIKNIEWQCDNIEVGKQNETFITFRGDQWDSSNEIMYGEIQKTFDYEGNELDEGSKFSLFTKNSYSSYKYLKKLGLTSLIIKKFYNISVDDTFIFLLNKLNSNSKFQTCVLDHKGKFIHNILNGMEWNNIIQINMSKWCAYNYESFCIFTIKKFEYYNIPYTISSILPLKNDKLLIHSTSKISIWNKGIIEFEIDLKSTPLSVEVLDDKIKIDTISESTIYDLMLNKIHSKEFLKVVNNNNILSLYNQHNCLLGKVRYPNGIFIDKFLNNSQLILSENKPKFFDINLNNKKIHAYEDIVELSLLKDTDDDLKASNNEIVLVNAVEKGHKEVVELLLEKGADVNAKNNNGETALHIASVGHKEIVELLLEKGADVNAKNNDDETAFHIAASTGHKEILELLLEKGADRETKDSEDKTALMMALNKGHKQIIELLLEKGADVNTKDSNNEILLHLAISWGNKEIVELLLEKGADVNTKDNNNQTSLHLAIALSWGRKGMVELLLEKGADVNAKNNNGETILHLAISSKDKEMVELLLEKGADVNAKNNNGETTLHIAASIGYKEILELLLEKGADVNAKNNAGETAFHIAASTGHKEILELLLEKGADVNTKDNNNQTSLHLAIALSWGRKGMVELLLEKGADVNAKNNNGETILHLAISSKDKEMVELLLEKGAEYISYSVKAQYREDEENWAKDFTISLNNLGNSYYDQEEYSEANKYYLEAKDIAKAYYDQGIIKWAEKYKIYCNNLANSFSKIRDNQKTLKYYLEVSSILSELYLDDEEKWYSDYLDNLDNIGNTASKAISNYQKSCEYYRKYFEILDIDKTILSIDEISWFIYPFVKYYQAMIRSNESLDSLDKYVKDMIEKLKVKFGNEYKKQIEVEHENYFSLRDSKDPFDNEKYEIFLKVFLG